MAFQINSSGSRLILSLDEKDYSKAMAATKACAPYIAAVKVHPEMPLYWKKSHSEAVVDIKKSCMAGDSFSDVLAGKALGIRSVFIGALKCDSCRSLGSHTPDGVFDSSLDFAKSLKNTKKRRVG